jgi:hypothetical protein
LPGALSIVLQEVASLQSKEEDEVAVQTVTFFCNVMPVEEKPDPILVVRQAVK